MCAHGAGALHPAALCWEGALPGCGGACVVRDVRHDGDRCVRGARRGRACERGRRGRAECARAGATAAARGASPGPTHPRLGLGARVRPGRAPPLTPSCPTRNSRPLDGAQGLPPRLGPVPAGGRNPCRAETPPPVTMGTGAFLRTGASPRSSAPALPPAPVSADHALPAPGLRGRGLGSARPRPADSGRSGGPLAAADLATPFLPP